MGGQRQVVGIISGFVRFIALDAAGGNVTVLGNDDSTNLYGGHIGDWLYDDPNALLIGDRRGGVNRISVADNRVLARPESPGAVPRDFLSDGRGRLRVLQALRVEADAALGQCFALFLATC